MSNQFWLGAYFGFAAGALIVLIPVAWWQNRRVDELLKQIFKDGPHD